MTTTYEFPGGVKPCSSLIMGDAEKTKRAIIEAAKWLADNQDFQPSFTAMAGHVFNTNDETKAMTTAVLDASNARENDKEIGLCFRTYAQAVIYIKKWGWDEYIKELMKIKT